MRAALLVAAGCASAPPIVLPARDAPIEVRRTAYVEDHIAAMAYGRHATSPRRPVLGDGRRPGPDQLSAVVTADSRTGRALARARHERKVAIDWGVAGAAAFLAMGGGLIAEGFELHHDPGLAIAPTFIAGMATELLFVLRSNAADERADAALEAAYATYDADLRDRLGLCTQGLKIVDCEIGD
jgi:hypothetical protein